MALNPKLEGVTAQVLLPLWQRVVFVDWYGVLSSDPFWRSILGSSTHPLHSRLEEQLRSVIAPHSPVFDEWMKGERCSRQIIEEMRIVLDGRYSHDYLYRRLVRDCSEMAVHPRMAEMLNTVRDKALLVLATDNIDCFVDAFVSARARMLKWRQGRRSLEAWAVFCDDLICSSCVGRTKSEDPEAFFGPWLRSHGLAFSDALLIDDRADNCRSFVDRGGSAIQWKTVSGDLADLDRSVARWLADLEPKKEPGSFGAEIAC
jgi:hypothetical protein